MIYNPTIPIDVERAKERFKWLISKGKTFELTEKRAKRSISQNNYLHLIIGWYAWDYGETFDYIKQKVFKKEVNREIFKTEYINRKTGEIRTDWRSTADLNTKEMTTAIDRFRDYASKEAGIYLPEPNDLVHLQEIEKELNNHAKPYI